MGDIDTNLESYRLVDIAAGIAPVAICAPGLLIGRDPDADLCVPEPEVSWRHAQISIDSQGIQVRDLGSSNGTFLNGGRLPESTAVYLQPQSVLAIGSRTFRLARALEVSNKPATQYLRPAADTTIVVGRAPDCTVVLDDPSVSWHHARICRQDDRWSVEDLGSANGTYRNELSIKSCSLGPDDRLRIGLHTFQLGEGGLACTDETGHIRLDAVNLTRVIWKNGQPITLLSDVSFTIQPRELVAIVGASGAGKSTLLLALNGYQPATSGRVYLNDTDFYSHRELFRTSVGYVPQKDIVHDELRVKSALTYAAQLRLPADSTALEIDKLVRQVMTELDILHRSDSRIGTLSGGEKKRVNIGVELLTRPSVLYLDEPTTGLDAGLERRVTQLFRTLADEGRTVIVVTHSVQTLDEYDRVIWMARGGHLAYSGPPKDLPAFFGVRDYAEAFDFMNAKATRSEDPAPFSAPSTEARRPGSGSPPPQLEAAKTSGLRQFAPLVQRYAEGIANDSRNLAIWLAQAPIVAIIIACLFASNTFAGSQALDERNHFPIQEGPRLLFMLAFCASCFALCNSCREIVKERAIFERERHVSLHAWPYILSKLVVLSAVSLVQCALLLAIVNARIPFHIDPGELLLMFLVLFLGAVNALILGLFISTKSSSPDQAITIVALVLLLQVIFSGLIPLEQMNAVFQGIAGLNLTRWIYGGLCGGIGLQTRLEDLGLSSHVQDLFKTPAANAAWVLFVMISIGLPLLRMSLVHRSSAST